MHDDAEIDADTAVFTRLLGGATPGVNNAYPVVLVATRFPVELLTGEGEEVESCQFPLPTPEAVFVRKSVPV